jgi:hypothetical protein
VKIRIAILFTLAFNSILLAQPRVAKPKISSAKGTMDVAWGYNSSVYTRSDLKFFGEDYRFTLEKVKAEDRQTPFSGVYFNPTKLTIPQYNVRLGYNFWDNYNLSVAYDHMKYVVSNNQEVRVQGVINPTADAAWAGIHNRENLVINHNHFRYENTGGLNYIRFQLTHIERYRLRKSSWFEMNTLLGLSSGVIVSSNHFLFGGEYTRRVTSLSGYGISGHIGMRFLFWRNFFLQGNFAGGFIHQTHVKLREEGLNYAKQKFGYAAFEGLIGLVLYVRPTNGCDSCPIW